jgi:hypothetical protein
MPDYSKRTYLPPISRKKQVPKLYDASPGPPPGRRRETTTKIKE